MRRTSLVLAALAAMVASGAHAETQLGDAQQGALLFSACAACHSLKLGQNMTGPSLAGVWGRKAGSLPDFVRYSVALKGSNAVWNAQTLDRWLKSPAQFIPGNYMTFAGDLSQRRSEEHTSELQSLAYL